MLTSVTAGPGIWRRRRRNAVRIVSAAVIGLRSGEGRGLAYRFGALTMISILPRAALGLRPSRSPLQARTGLAVGHVEQGQRYSNVMRTQSRHSAAFAALKEWRRLHQFYCRWAFSCFLCLCQASHPVALHGWISYWSKVSKYYQEIVVVYYFVYMTKSFSKTQRLSVKFV